MMRHADELEVPVDLRGLAYVGAVLERILRLPNTPFSPYGIVMSTMDPMATVTGHYLALAALGDQQHRTSSPDCDEVTLVAGNVRVHIHGGRRTTVIAMLSEADAVDPPQAPSPPQAATQYAATGAQRSDAAGMLAKHGVVTKPLDTQQA